MMHLMTVHGTTRRRGVVRDRPRCGSSAAAGPLAAPAAMRRRTPLSDSEGRCSIRSSHPAARRARAGRDGARSTSSPASPRRARRRSALDGEVPRPRLADRVFELAWTHSQILLRQLNATEADAQVYGRLAGSIIYANASLRARPRASSPAIGAASPGLWGYGISGDLPIVLCASAIAANLELVRQVVQAHAYWRLKGSPSTW